MEVRHFGNGMPDCLVKSAFGQFTSMQMEILLLINATTTWLWGPIASVRHNAGRTFVAEKSSNGNGNSTIFPLITAMIYHPPSYKYPHPHPPKNQKQGSLQHPATTPFQRYPLPNYSSKNLPALPTRQLPRTVQPGRASL